jgi:predicted AlkP superfamily phosphohydrolase/phosphomutase
MRETNRSARVALIGLDGATYRLLDPVAAAGAMPCLAAVRKRGLETILRSTIPAYTPPAWVSMSTGVNPGRHGIFGFLANTPQESPRIAHSGLIDALPIWRYLTELGVQSGTFNVPISYPPSSVAGFMVSGGLAAGWTNPEMGNFASDSETARLVTEVAGRNYPLDTVVSYENDWRSPGVISRVLDIQRLRRRVLRALLDSRSPEFVYAVFEGPDRLMHLFYQYIVECSDWYSRPEASEVRDRALEYFAELDKAIEDLVQWAGSDGHVVVVSDHGSGPWEKTINMNLLLEDWGYLRLPAIGKLTTRGMMAGAGQRLARRLIPRRLLHVAKARVTRKIVWSDTLAFASHVAEQGIHVNVRGTHPNGVADPARRDKIVDELAERLMQLTDPSDGQPVTDRVVRRDEVISGGHVDRSPDLFPLCRDQRYELSDTLAATGPITDHRDRPWGYHHMDGIFIAAGPRVASGRTVPTMDIVDVLPTSLRLAGLPVPEGLDGNVIHEVLVESAPADRATIDVQADQVTSTAYPYSKEEEAAIEESLRALGYID